MSGVNILGVVSNIKVQTNVYTPIIEAIVNSIQSIEKTGRDDGEIIIKLVREVLLFKTPGDDSLPDITSIEITDNGIGFNEENTESFDTLYSQLKSKDGGKGFGRFMFLKYFTSVHIKSIFKDGDVFYLRSFDFGVRNEMVANQKLVKTKNTDFSTTIFLKDLKSSKLDKKNTTIARKILEKILVYFIDDKYKCPKIIIRDGNDDIVLNDLLKGDYPEISLINSTSFELKNEDIIESFKVKIFKIFFPDNQKSRISLVANNREVVETPIYTYYPEYEDNFYEEVDGVRKDFMIKTYVIGNYLDKNVSLERTVFNFPKKDKDKLYLFTQFDIENEAARLTDNLDDFKDEIKSRREKKKKRIYDYVNLEAPWHKDYLENIDFRSIPFNLTDEDIDMELHRVEFQYEMSTKADIKKILDESSLINENDIKSVSKKISKVNKSKLVHYVVLRKQVLNLLEKSLSIKDDGNYNKEESVHNIIFPTRSTSDDTNYENHNLWILDEKLNFTEFLSSDEPINGGKSERADILVFNKKIAFRGENEACNPITIFEFKKPQRDDFCDQSSKEDPVQQIIRYTNSIKDGKFKTPNGRDILVSKNTPFYGYIVCDLTEKVKTWLLREKGFQEMPDNLGWFNWMPNINLYMEVKSWDKVLKDSKMNNKVFFKMLDIE
jgi:hypothetical protein